ncbi:MAG: hypothetical protein IPP44_25680 [Ideonella sp.]|nr:hypothetical protein [Ideonella sp.]
MGPVRMLLGLLLGLFAAAAAPAADPPRHPHLAADVYAITHVDASQSDAIPYAVPRGTFRIDLKQLKQIPGGPVNNMTYAAAVPGFMWSVSTDRVAYIDARDGRWELVTDIDLPGAQRRDAATLRRIVDTRYTSIEQAEQVLRQALGPRPGALLPAGVYSLVDADNVVWSNAGTWVSAIGLKNAADPKSGLEVKRRFDMATVLEPDDFGPPYGRFISLVGMGLTWSGQLVVGSTNAIAVLDRSLEGRPQVYRFPPGQMATNSFATDERNAIYVATGSKTPRRPGLMMKLAWTGSRISDAEADGGWVAEYEGGDWPPAIKAGTGTGSTPTLMGFGADEDRLVLITDGANRMKLVGFWRDAIPAGHKPPDGARSPRVAAQLPITAGLPADTPWVQSEQSVVVHGWGAFVVNNLATKGHPDRIIDVFTMGPVHEPARGVERVRWDPASRTLRSVWTRADVVSASMVPIVSRPSGIVFVNGYAAREGWEVTGLDWETGATVFRTVFGSGNDGNGAYAILQFLANGDLLFNSVGGPFRIPLR